MLEALDFEALATTSSGFAFTLGQRDGSVGLAEMVAHAGALDAATSLPVSVDLENGYGPEPDDAAAAIAGCAAAGAVGASIEDWDPSGRIYSIEHAVERIAAAVEAARSLGFPFTLTARAENHVRSNPDLTDTIERLRAYEEAGADVLFAPGLDLDGVRELRAATRRPLNVLARSKMTVAEIVAAGAQRISLGGGLAWVGVAAAAEAARRIAADGDLSALGARPPLDDWLGD